MNPLIVIVVALILAIAAEGTVEVLFGRPIDHIPKLVPFKTDILTYIGIAVSIGLTCFYRVDLLYAVSSLASGSGIEPSIIGFIVSGTIVGRGSNAVHDFITNILGPKPAVTSTTTTTLNNIKPGETTTTTTMARVEPPR